jgi:hypothetical protein
VHTMNATTRIATPAGMAILGLEAAERWLELDDAREEHEENVELARARADLGWVATAMLRRAAIGGGS